MSLGVCDKALRTRALTLLPESEPSCALQSRRGGEGEGGGITDCMKGRACVSIFSFAGDHF